MLEQFKMEHCKIAQTSYRSGLKLDCIKHNNNSKSKKEHTFIYEYQSIIGCLNWLSINTQPNVNTVYSSFSQFNNNPPPGWYNPTDFYLSKEELHSQQSFGKNNLLTLYTVLPVLSQIAVSVWKSGYLGKTNDKPTTLAKTLPYRETTLSMLSNLSQVDFSALNLLPFDYDIFDSSEEEKTIIANKKVMKNAYMLHYDIDLSAV